MKSMFVKINGFKDISDVIKQATLVDGDVTYKKGKYVVDGKSTLGVMSLDLSTGVTIEYPEDAEVFENFIKQFEV